jgi:molybdate-binding protein/DNA-binding XRE family transcriptional regulator
MSGAVTSTVAQHRQQRQWSQAQLSAQSGVSRAEISAIETGRLVPSVAVALRLAEVLDLTVEALFNRQGAASRGQAWAWAPATPDDPRMWRATVGGHAYAYPVEFTAAGVIPHDAVVTSAGIEVVAPHVSPDRTLVIAGCDPLVGLVVQGMAEQHGIRLLPLLRSSAQALELLRQGLVHAAGMHLTDGDGHSTNDAVVGARLGGGYALIHQLRWEAGIALSHDRRERSARAVVRANLRWVNREEGSAARDALDALLGRRRPKGYRHVVRDHRAVAATISSGWAEAGVCIRPAAVAEQLSFIPLQQEAYELCVPESLVRDPRITGLIATLRSVRYRQFITHIPGCGVDAAGDQRLVGSSARA